MNPLFGQLINLLGALLLMLAFAMISQRRILSLIHLFTLQGATLVVATAVSVMSPTSRTCTSRRRSRWD